MSKYKKCDYLLERNETATCSGDKKNCPKTKVQCHVTAVCWKVPDNEQKSCKTCRWITVCIDPCDDCPNMLNVKFDENHNPIEDTLCKFEQGDSNCRKVAGINCKQYQRKLKSKFDPQVEKIKKMYE